MADQVIQLQELVDAREDAQDLDQFSNGPATVIETRYGGPRKTMLKIEQDAQAQIVDATARKFFDTKALMDADVSNQPVGMRAYVDKDPVVSNNGQWVRGAVVWEKTVLQPASSIAVSRPVETGKIPGWQDPFFRKITPSSGGFEGRLRVVPLTGATSFMAGFGLVKNSVFDGQALRRLPDLVATNYGAATLLYLDELNVIEGDTFTVYTAYTGNGASIIGAVRFLDASGNYVGSQLAGFNAGGTAGLIASPTPQWLRHQIVVPAGVNRLVMYPYTNTVGQGFDVVAIWAFKGLPKDGPEWPSLDMTPVVAAGLVATEAKVSVVEGRVSGVESAAAYAVDTYTSVSASATAVVVPVTGIFAGVRDLPFRGWGYTYSPAGVSFNAIRLKELKRVAALVASRWRTLRVVVRTGPSPAGAGATVIAVGSVLVLSTADTLTDVTFVLKDPVTGAVKTLSNADFGGQPYFIAVYAVNAAGGPASCGEPGGTLPNGLGQSYYIANATDPLTAAFTATASGSNSPLGFSHLMLTSPIESVSYAASAKLAADLAAAATPAAPEMVMPPYVFGVAGRECNVYFDNLIEGASNWDFDVTAAAVGTKQQNERFTWIPTAALAAGTLAISALDRRSGATLVSKTAQLRAAAAAAGTGLTKKVLAIGDSLINAGVITQTLLDIAATDPMKITLLGTRGTGANKHEGRGGWRIADYATAGRTYRTFSVSGVTQVPSLAATQYTHNGTTYQTEEVAITGGSGTISCAIISGPDTPAASGVLTKSNGSAGDATIAFSSSASVAGNPFWIGGAINFGQYLINNGISAPDWVPIALGINDVFGQTTDAGASDFAYSSFVQLDVLIASIKAADANTRIALVIPTPPSYDQDSFGANYGTGQTRARFKRNILIWARQLIAKYSGQEASRIYLLPSNTALDTVHNMNFDAAAPVNSRSSTTVARQSNGVHPAVSGYQQIGDAWWAFLKFYA